MNKKTKKDASPGKAIAIASAVAAVVIVVVILLLLRSCGAPVDDHGGIEFDPSATEGGWDEADLDAIRDSLHGSVPTKEQIAEAVKRAVAEINEKLPSYKRIRSYKIRESAFEKTTTQKIKRFGDNMKDE